MGRLMYLRFSCGLAIDLFNSNEILEVNKTPVRVSSSTRSFSFKHSQHFYFPDQKYINHKNADPTLYTCLVKYVYLVPSLGHIQYFSSSTLAKPHQTKIR